MKPRDLSNLRLCRCAAWVLALTLAGAALPAQAQLRLPSIGLPALPRQAPAPLADTLRDTLPLHDLRRDTVRDLLRRHADVLEADTAGEPVRRGELLLLTPPPATVAAALAQGFVLLREQELPELELRQVVLRAPAAMSATRALALLRSIDPQARVDFNHVYTRSGEVAAGPPLAAVAVNDTPAAPRSSLRRVGLVDGGIDSGHSALRRAQIHSWGCSGEVRSSAHGTAIASLLVGSDAAFAGVLPHSTLYAADIYCNQPEGGSVEGIAQALAWMARERVAVVNVSLVGPANLLLESAVKALVRRGHLIVAAVGNDGPAAPPLYPAAYDGVVGVTGVTAARRVLIEAAQGPQVMLAAPGGDMVVAQFGGGYRVARGTSYAAPIVAGLLADRLTAPDEPGARAALALLVHSAQDLGAPGRDPVFGFGLVGESARVAPDRLLAHSR